MGLPWQHATDEKIIFLSKSYDPSVKIAAASLSTPTTWKNRGSYVIKIIIQDELD